MGCKNFASGPLVNNKVVSASASFVPVFIDTLGDASQYKRFDEHWGSYPVLRIHNLQGEEIGGRIDGNLVGGRIPVSQILAQFDTAKVTFTP